MQTKEKNTTPPLCPKGQRQFRSVATSGYFELAIDITSDQCRTVLESLPPLTWNQQFLEVRHEFWRRSLSATVMGFVDWCTQVLARLVDLGKDSSAVYAGGASGLQLGKVVFGESFSPDPNAASPTGYDALMLALQELQTFGLASSAPGDLAGRLRPMAALVPRTSFPAVMWDGRETVQPITTNRSDPSTLTALQADLMHQANDATATPGHAQATVPLTADQQRQIMAFELSLFGA